MFGWLAKLVIEGGWGSWSVLLFGTALLVSAGRFAWRPEKPAFRVVKGLVATILVVSVHATWTNLGVTFGVMEDPQKVPDPEVMRFLFMGLRQSSYPGALAGIFLTLACLLVTIGFSRQSASALKSAAPPAEDPA